MSATHEKAAAAPKQTAAHISKNQPQGIVLSGRLQAPFESDFLDSLRPLLADYLAAQGVELRKQGNRLVGRCPAHDDRSPSFAVFGSRQETCGCFPCGFTGDVFAVSTWLGRSASFPEAVRDVASALGIPLPNSPAGTATRPATAPPRPAKPPEPPFTLSLAERKTVEAARLAFSNAFWGGDNVVDDIAASLGLDRETLRFAAWGSSGLGLACPRNSSKPWLCYAYPEGLNWRNPHPGQKPRFQWLVGKATAPWRMDWASGKETVYVTEGESDCLALIAAGMETESAACVATPGTSFQKKWASLFTGKRVVLCFDSDQAGRAATATVAAILKGHAREIHTWRAGQ
jgi:hypothetical protein